MNPATTLRFNSPLTMPDQGVATGGKNIPVQPCWVSFLEKMADLDEVISPFREKGLLTSTAQEKNQLARACCKKAEEDHVMRSNLPDILDWLFSGMTPLEFGHEGLQKMITRLICFLFYVISYQKNFRDLQFVSITSRVKILF